MTLSSEIRRRLFPISIAANKADNQVHRCTELKKKLRPQGERSSSPVLRLNLH